MFIKCWGSRGSIPVSGSEYVRYGGDTTCIEIRSDNNAIIVVDAGTGLRRLGNALIAEQAESMDFIFTHAHWDHLMGFPFFKPLYHDNVTLRMQGCPFARVYVEKLISRVMAPPNFPVTYAELKAKLVYEKVCPTRMDIDSVAIHPIPISHPNRGAGYKFVEGGGTFVFLTDNELDHRHDGGRTYGDYLDFCRGADLLIHDAEFTPKEYKLTRSWGHSVYTSVVKLAMEAGVRTLGLFHLNQDRVDNDMDELVEAARKMVEKEGSDLEVVGVARDMVFRL